MHFANNNLNYLKIVKQKFFPAKKCTTFISNENFNIPFFFKKLFVSLKPIWACSLCQQRQRILAKTGKWFQQAAMADETKATAVPGDTRLATFDLLLHGNS